MLPERGYLSAALLLLVAGTAVEWSVRSDFFDVLGNWRSFSSLGSDVMALSTNALATVPTVELIVVLVVLAMPGVMTPSAGGSPPLWFFVVLQVTAALTVVAIGLSLVTTLFFGFLFSPPTIGETTLLVVSNAIFLPAVITGGALWHLSRTMRRYFAARGFHA